MEEHDVFQVHQLEVACFSEPWSLESFREIVDCDYVKFFVVEIADKIEGICGLRNIVGEGEITNVAVSQQYRGKKIGTRILEEVFKQGELWGIKEYTLDVRVSNVAAIALYEKVGFVSEGIRKNYYHKPTEDGMVMWKRSIESA